MADIESNVKVNIDTSDALAQLKLLQQQISAFQQAMRKAGADNAAAARAMQQNLVNSINATGKFQANIQTIQTSAERFTTALEKNKLTMSEYFRYAGGASKTFGKLFKQEFETINQVARERVKDLQTQYIKLGRDANGAMKAISVRPTTLDMRDFGTQTQIAAQRQQLFNQLMKQGSTQLLNFGKNTQWAGRQLMVGFTVPLTMMGSAAAKAYMEIEKASVSFQRVYGDMNTTTEETQKMVNSVRQLANEFTKYGVAVADTMEMAAKAAAMGKTGADLLEQISQANKLSVLGQVDQNQALETTISLTNAFGTSADELAGKIDFLNAVENQTVTSIEDLTIAIPKAAPVIKQLGGDVEDLTFFLTAMKEGGINASEGANALKSGIASMINPTKKASDFLAGFGINVKGIVEKDKGNIKNTVIDMAKAFDTLDPLNRARAIEMMFGKFQFSRISTLFQNVIKEGSQAQTVAGLAKDTAEELAVLSEREMKKISDSPMYKFQKSIQDIQAKLAPIGEAFLKAVTPIIDFVGKVLDGFNNLSEGTKGFITILVTAVAGIGPLLLMTFGLVANGIANVMKLFTNIKGFVNKTTKPSDILGEQTSYMTSEQLKGAAIASSLDQAHAKLRQTFTSEASAVNDLTMAYRNAIQAQQQFSGVPGVDIGNPNAVPPKKYANGVSMVPGPAGAGDIVPALLSPGEAVIPAKHARKYAPVIAGMVAGNLPGFEEGTTGAGMRQTVYGPMTQKQIEGMARTGGQLKDISDGVMAGPYGMVQPTDFGTQISPTTGHSFPAFGVGGIYEKPNGTRVFVKPQMDLTSALAEIRGTTIARDAHGLVSPQQQIRVMMDPTDPDNQRRFIVLESPVDERFAEVPQTFTKDQYFKQLVASLLRGDKDLGVGNLGGDVLADVGTAGVFGRASGKRALGSAINSMEEQAIINLLAVKGGAKRFFAESTRDIAASMTPEEYDATMKAEIAKVLPRLKTTIDGFGPMSGEEAAAYQAMIKRLEDGSTVDWSRYQAIHSAVTPAPVKVKKLNAGDKKVEGVPHDPIIGTTDGSRTVYDYDGSKWVLITQESHAQDELAYKDVQEQLGFLGAGAETFKNFKILGNLTMSLPDKLNQQLRVGGKKGPAGMETGPFRAVYNALQGKMKATLKKTLGLKSPTESYTSASQQIEDKIGMYAIANAQMGRVNDPSLAKGATQALQEYAKTQGPIGELANKYLERAGLVGTLRQVVPEEFDASGKALKDDAVLRAQFNRGELVYNTTGKIFTPVKASEKLRSARFALTPNSKDKAKRAQEEAIRDAWVASGAKSPLPPELKLRGNSVEEGLMSNKETGFLSYDSPKTGFGPEVSIVDMQALIDHGMIKRMEDGGFVKTGKKPKASVFDIDDTLLDLSSFMIAHKAENEKLPEDQKKKWYKEVAKDPKGIPAGLAALKAAQQRGNKILLMTARPDFYEPYTRETLEKLGIDMKGIKLIARKDKDYRKPYQMKYDKTAAYMKYYDIEEFYDDMPETRGAISLLNIPTYDPLKLAQGIFSVPGKKGAGDVVPAMLSPGEAVIPADKAEKHRGLISNMIHGNLPGYRNGTVGVGIPGFANGGFVQGYETGGFISDKYNEGHPLPVMIVEDRTDKPSVDEQTDKDTTVPATGDVPMPDGEEKKKGRHAGPTWTERAKGALSKAFTRNETTGKVQSAMYGLTTVAGLATQIPGKVGEAAQAAMGPIGAATTAMGLIPGPAGLVAAGLAAAVVGVNQYLASLEKLSKETAAHERAMGTSNEALGKFAEFSKKATASEVMDKRRQQSAGQFFNVVQGKTTFGESYMKTDAGKALVKSVDTEISKGGGLKNAQSLITNQLSEAITSGVMTPAQARSIAANLGTQLGNANFALEVNASLTDIMGPNGENLKNQPLEVRMKIVESSMDQVRSNAATLGKTTGGDNKAAAVGSGVGNAVVGGLAGAAAGGLLLAGSAGLAASGLAIAAEGTLIAGLAAAGSALPVIGTIAGALTGLVIAGISYQNQITEQSAALAESVGNTLEVEQQMVDSLQVSYERRIAEAKAAGDTAEAVRLQNQYLIDQKALLDANKQTNIELFETYNNMDTGWGFMFNSQQAASDTINSSIEEAYKGTGMEAEAKLAREAVDSAAGTQAQDNFIKTAMAKKLIGINQVNTAMSVFGDSEEGMTQFVKLLENSPTEANRSLTIASGIQDQTLRENYMNNVAEMDPVDLLQQNNALEIANKTRGVFQGEASEAILRYSVENPETMIEFNDNIQKLKDEKTITVGVATKFLKNDKDGIDAIQSKFSKFNKYNKANKVVFMTELQQILAMKGDATMIEAFKVWRSEQGDSTLTFADYAAYQADRTVTTQGVDNTTGPGSAADVKPPEASVLDQFVQMTREGVNFQQKLTVGWDASYKALKNYSDKSLKVMGGFAARLKQLGVSGDIIDVFMGATEEEQNKIMNKRTGQLKKGALSLLQELKKIKDMKEYGLAYVLMDDAQRLAKDNELYQAGLDAIATKEKGINDKYDARIKALDAISRLQEKSNQHQQDTLDLAGALSKGDIAAAAQIALKAKQNDQRQALEDAKASLELQRKNELDAIEVTILGHTKDRSDLEKLIADNSVKIADAKLLEMNRQAKIAKDALKSSDAVAKMLADGKKLSLLPGYNGGPSGGPQGDPLVDDKKANIGKVGYDSKGNAVVDPNAGNAYAQMMIGTSGMTTAWDFKNYKWTTVKKDANQGKAGYVLDKNTPGKWIQQTAATFKAAGVQLMTGDYATKADATKAVKNPATQEVYWESGDPTGKNTTFGVWKIKTVGASQAQPRTMSVAKNTEFKIPIGAYVYSVTPTTTGYDFVYGTQPYTWHSESSRIAKPKPSKGNSLVANAALLTRIFEDTQTGKFRAYDTNGVESMQYKIPFQFASGGLVPRAYADGGAVYGTDTISAMLTPGEFVINKSAVDSIGVDNLKAMNNGTSINDSVYNYNVTLNVSSSSNSNDIADAVLTQIKRLDSQRLRSNVI